jgi:hypothetical protein
LPIKVGKLSINLGTLPINLGALSINLGTLINKALRLPKSVSGFLINPATAWERQSFIPPERESATM